MSPRSVPVAAIYVRVSTTRESQKDSPEHQEGICREKARILGLTVPDDLVYEDRDSGTSIVERPAIRRLLADARAGRFQAVLFASLSRFSRDLVDSMALKRMLVDALNVRLVSIDENYDSGVDPDEFKFQIFSAVNQKQSEMISLSSRRGIRQSALKGNFTGSIPPFGYKKAMIDGRKTLVPDEAASGVVREIFRLYTACKLGDKAIAAALNERGIPSPKGGRWGATTVQRILQNEAYTGVNVFGKYETVKVHSLTDLHNRRNKLVRRDRSKWERAAMGQTHEPIIDPDLFRAAQEIRRLRGGGRGGVRRRRNVFAGFIFCAHCGASMVSQKSKIRRFLVCSRRRRQGPAGCENGYRLPYESFRDALLENLSARLAAVVRVEELLDRHREALIAPARDRERGIARLEARIRRCREAIAMLNRDWVDGRLDREQVEREKSRFERELWRLEERLDEMKAQELRLEGVRSRLDRAREAINDLIRLRFDDKEAFDELHFILRKLVISVRVDAGGMAVVQTAFRNPLPDRA
mgnify:CR=1 FL=1